MIILYAPILTMGKKRTVKSQNSVHTNVNKLSWSVIGTWTGVIASAITIVTIIFGIGYWVAGIEHKVEIMNLNQKHNQEISILRIELNSQIQAMQNRYDILEAKYNTLKDEKEVNREK